MKKIIKSRCVNSKSKDRLILRLNLKHPVLARISYVTQTAADN